MFFLVVNGIFFFFLVQKIFAFAEFLSSHSLYTAKKFSRVGEELFVLEMEEVNVPLKEQ